MQIKRRISKMIKLLSILVVMFCATAGEGFYPAQGNSKVVGAVHPVMLVWKLSGNPETTYNVYRAPVKCNVPESLYYKFDKVNAKPIAEDSFDDTDVLPPGQYCYYVTAVVGPAESDRSNMIQLEQPTPPAGLHQVTGKR
jgi:hypothetical protein